MSNPPAADKCRRKEFYRLYKSIPYGFCFKEDRAKRFHTSTFDILRFAFILSLFDETPPFSVGVERCYGQILMQNKHQKFGEKSENLAVWYLKQNGYKIIEQNYRNRMGEIDIIARDKKTIVFVEVKSRRSIRYGSPKLAVTPKKQRTISMVALYYLKTTKQTDAKARFDVVAIISNRDEPQIEIVKNAFELAYE